MATTGIGSVHVDAIRTSQTVRHVGEVLSVVGSGAIISCLNASAVSLDVWTPTVGGAGQEAAARRTRIRLRCQRFVHRPAAPGSIARRTPGSDKAAVSAVFESAETGSVRVARSLPFTCTPMVTLS